MLAKRREYRLARTCLERTLRGNLYSAWSDYQAVCPPSTTSTCPVTNAEASDARNTAAPFRSWSPPKRCNGIRASKESFRCSITHSDMWVGNHPGAIALTRILCAAHL